MPFKSIVSAVLFCAIASPVFAEQPAPGSLKPVKQIDSIWNGALIGAAVGIVPAVVATRATCGPNDGFNECTGSFGPIAFLICVPAGAAAGAIVDRLINKTLPPAANAHLSLAPMLSQQNGRKSAGVALKLRVRF